MPKWWAAFSHECLLSLSGKNKNKKYKNKNKQNKKKNKVILQPGREIRNTEQYYSFPWLMHSVWDSGSRDPGSSPGQVICVVHSASLLSGEYKSTSNYQLRGKLDEMVENYLHLTSIQSKRRKLRSHGATRLIRLNIAIR